MHAVIAEARAQTIALVAHRRVIVEIDGADARGVRFHPRIQRHDLWRRHKAALPGIVEHGQHRRQHDANSVRLRHFRHRHQVPLDHFWRGRSGVAGDIVGTAKDHHDGGFERHDIGMKAHQHLRCRLPANATTDVRLAGKHRREVAHPPFGDRVAHEHHAALTGRRRGKFSVDVAIVREACVVVPEGRVGGALTGHGGIGE